MAVKPQDWVDEGAESMRPGCHGVKAMEDTELEEVGVAVVVVLILPPRPRLLLSQSSSSSSSS